MAVQDEDAQTLAGLGLTVSQAKVYLALLKLEKATGKTLSQHSKVARQEAYRILAELQEKGLVEKIIASPTVFKTIPLEDCLHLLIERKKTEISEIQKKATKLLQQFKEKNSKNTLQEEESQFILVPEKEASLRKFTNTIANTKTSCDMILHWECFRYGMIEDTETWKKTVEKGAKIRFIVYKSEDEKAVSQIVQMLKEKGSFNVRYISRPPPATLAIFDKKKTSITTSPTPNPLETPHLWSNNPGLIAIFQDYFELMWRTSTKTNTK